MTVGLGSVFRIFSELQQHIYCNGFDTRYTSSDLVTRKLRPVQEIKSNKVQIK